MCDEQDGFAFLRKSSHYFHKLINFLRSKNCCRLIENKNFVIPVQHLEDLYSLLHSYSDILNLGINVNFQTVFF